jgi:hypothetical protein
MQRWHPLLAVAVAVALGQAAPAGTAKAWVGNETRVEAHLRTAAVTRIEDIGTGVTRPRRAYLSPAEPAASATWKVLPPGSRSGFYESYKSEIAAYELDKLLGMRMVPPAVEREIDGDTGAAVMWIDGVRSVKQMGGTVPSGPEWGAAIRRMLMFDDLIGNPDRNAGNILVAEPGTFILIDHSRAFVPATRLPNRLERVDADLWERITTVTEADLTRVVGPWLDRGALSAMLARRARMVEDVGRLVKKNGAAAVIIR